MALPTGAFVESRAHGSAVGFRAVQAGLETLVSGASIAIDPGTGGGGRRSCIHPRQNATARGAGPHPTATVLGADESLAPGSSGHRRA